LLEEQIIEFDNSVLPASFISALSNKASQPQN
jgi:hypothetical protein